MSTPKKKEAKDNKMECPLCHAIMRPSYQNGGVYCSACMTDLLPYAEAYAEYVRIRADQNKVEF